MLTVRSVEFVSIIIISWRTPFSALQTNLMVLPMDFSSLIVGIITDNMRKLGKNSLKRIKPSFLNEPKEDERGKENKIFRQIFQGDTQQKSGGIRAGWRHNARHGMRQRLLSSQIREGQEGRQHNNKEDTH